MARGHCNDCGCADHLSDPDCDCACHWEYEDWEHDEDDELEDVGPITYEESK